MVKAVGISQDAKIHEDPQPHPKPTKPSRSQCWGYLVLVPFVWTKGLSKSLYNQTWALAAFLGAPAATPAHLRCPKLNRASGVHLFPQQG